MVEGSINMGSWTAVDPLQFITVYGPDNSVLAERAFESTGGVKVFNLVLVQDGGSVQFKDSE